MKRFVLTASMAAILMLGWTGPMAQAQPAAPAADQPAAAPPIPAEEQPDVLTSGPVHEAFAEPIDVQSQEGVVAPSAPPADIQEDPPAERPAGDSYVWVPGYWGWDHDRNDYIWVSACWRVAPPNVAWVPGYWSRVGTGWEWIAGFWSPSANQEIEYLPAPPAPVEVQPSGSPPNADSIWVPPCWYWRQDKYVLRAGYWLTAQPAWVWVPAHNLWTPRGYIFVAGHWDYPLERRGVLFAPVHFARGVYLRAGFSFTPSIVVDLGVLNVNLFAYPRYRHYYFGDYYDDAYVRIGIYPCIDSQRLHVWYDPIFEYDRCHFRQTDPRWEEQQRHEFELRRDDKSLRPARTYREMEARAAKLPEAQRRDFRVARPFSEEVASKSTKMKFERVDTDVRKKIVTEETDMRKFRQDRGRWESEDSGAGQPPKQRGQPENTPPQRKAPGAREVRATKPERVKMPTMPIRGKSTGADAGDKGAPQRSNGDRGRQQERDNH